MCAVLQKRKKNEEHLAVRHCITCKIPLSGFDIVLLQVKNYHTYQIIPLSLYKHIINISDPLLLKKSTVRSTVLKEH